MRRQRYEAVENVANAFRSFEAAAEATAVSGAACMTVMLDERRRANLPVATGAKELEKIAEGVLHAVRAHAQLVQIHSHMAALPAQIGVKMYGTEGDCPPNEPFFGATLAPPLKVVA